MSDPKHQADHAWTDAEALVEHIEHSAQSGMSAESFYDELTSSLRLTLGASTVTLWFTEGPDQTILARQGVSLHQEQIVGSDHQGEEGRADHTSRSCWSESEIGSLLLVTQRVDADVSLGLDILFDRSIDAGQRQTHCELVEVLLDLAATVFLRSKLVELRGQLSHQSTRDALINRLSEGVGLTDSFTAIASAIASETSVDRVSLIGIQSSKHRLIATSSQSKIDRRARQVRMLERLAESALSTSDRFWFTVGGSPTEPSCNVNNRHGENNTGTSETLEAYVHHSGCREIYLEAISSEDGEDDIAVVVLERFRLPADTHASIQSLLDPIREPLQRAVGTAIRREDSHWGLIAARFASPTSRNKLAIASIVSCILVLAACFVPATLKIPAEGRIVAAQRNRLFAPTQGIVAEIAVRNGQQVRKGDTLLQLRSPDLELQQRNIEAALSTAMTRLDSLTALRSRSGTQSNRQRDTNASADEKVLKTEIEGLEQALQLVHQQQSDLTITSPMDGQVDRWDLQQSLNARPVTHGQHLFDVISNNDGWRVELELPDKNVNYVLEHQRVEPCRCTFRLRSNPTTIHQGTISRIDDVAHINPLGQSMVRITLPVESAATDDFRSGATVMAQLDCGKRPLGFVWLRGIFEWSRSQAWF